LEKALISKGSGGLETAKLMVELSWSWLKKSLDWIRKEKGLAPGSKWMILEGYGWVHSTFEVVKEDWDKRAEKKKTNKKNNVLKGRGIRSLELQKPKVEGTKSG